VRVVTELNGANTIILWDLQQLLDPSRNGWQERAIHEVPGRVAQLCECHPLHHSVILHLGTGVLPYVSGCAAAHGTYQALWPGIDLGADLTKCMAEEGHNAGIGLDGQLGRKQCCVAVLLQPSRDGIWQPLLAVQPFAEPVDVNTHVNAAADRAYTPVAAR
jgi:hypothetical protein